MSNFTLDEEAAAIKNHKPRLKAWEWMLVYVIRFIGGIPMNGQKKKGD